MTFYSICPTMTEDAKKLPDNVNVKLFLRHSIRYDNPVNGDYEHLDLTPEGIELARKMGKSIDRPIGALYSSKVNRCRQTAMYMAEGAGINNPDITFVDEYVRTHFQYAAEVLNTSWFEYYYSLQRDILVRTGGITLADEIKPMLDKIFSEEGKAGELDIICSHDSHVVLLASKLFDYKTGLHGENWCNYTEGIFFYGKREDFVALWRGEERHFVNYLM